MAPGALSYYFVVANLFEMGDDIKNLDDDWGHMNQCLRKAAAIGCYAVCIALIYYALWLPPALPGLMLSEVECESIYHLSSCMALCCALAVLYLVGVPRRRESILLLSFLGSVLMLCGLMVPYLFSQIAPGASWILTVCGAITGTAAALVFVCWECFYSDKEPVEYWLEIVAGSMGSSLLIALANLVIPVEIARLAFISLGVVALVVFEGLLMRGMDAPRVCSTTAADRRRGLIGLLRDQSQVIICFAVIGLVYGAVRATVSIEAESKAVDGISTISMLASGVFLLIFRSKLPQWSASRAMYRAVFLLASLGFLAMPFLGKGFWLVFSGLAGFAFFMASMVMVGFSCAVAEERDVPATMVFTPIACAVYVMLGLGYQMKFAFYGDSFGLTERLIVALICLWIVSVAFALAGRRDTRDYEGAAQTQAVDAATVSAADLTRAVQNLSEAHALTRRESQTLALLAEGRNVPFIADELCLSADTVRTYIKAIHSKLGVHSRQELISLVRSCGVEREGVS